MSDSAAKAQGFTQEIFATGDVYEFQLLVKPDTDYDSRFKAWDMDGQEFLLINGWLYSIEEVQAA